MSASADHRADDKDVSKVLTLQIPLDRTPNPQTPKDRKPLTPEALTPEPQTPTYEYRVLDDNMNTRIEKTTPLTLNP